MVKYFSKPIVPETPDQQPEQPTQEPANKPWQSKHLVDNEVGLVAQIKKAFTLQGDDKLEAYKEIAVQMDMSPDSVTASNQKYSKRAIKKYRELTADIRKNKIKDVNVFLGQLIGIMSEINRDYANQLVGFMLENYYN